MFSIGYATKPIATYVRQLQDYGVTVVADIRSVPYSRTFADYHRETLMQHLQNAGLRYVYLGAELGPRSSDPDHYDEEGQVQFPRLIQSPLYKAGIQRLFDGLGKGFTIALTCACKDPAICHRSLLVGHSLLHQHCCELQHIRHEGELESQHELECRLLTVTETQTDLLTGSSAAMTLAWERQCRNFAYRRKPERGSPR